MLIINTLESPAQSGIFVVCFRRLDGTIKSQSRFAGRTTGAGQTKPVETFKSSYLNALKSLRTILAERQTRSTGKRHVIRAIYDVRVSRGGGWGVNVISVLTFLICVFRKYYNCICVARTTFVNISRTDGTLIRFFVVPFCIPSGNIECF